MYVSNDIYRVFLDAGYLSELLNFIEKANPEILGFNFLSISEDDKGLVSYIKQDKKQEMEIFLKETKEKESKSHYVYWESDALKLIRKEKATKTKIGRVLGKVIDISKNTEMIEKISALLSGSDYFFEIVEGNDIAKYYLQKNSDLDVSDLRYSCMRKPECQDYFSLYVENPSLVKMLILKNKKSQKDIICGRALLWQNVEVSGNSDPFSIKMMDRIYSNTILKKLFEKWAVKNGYYYKDSANLLSNKRSTISLDSNGIEITTPEEYEFYPYLDSFSAGYQDSNSYKIYSYPHKSIEKYDFRSERKMKTQNGGIIDDYCCICGEPIIYEHDDYIESVSGEIYCEDHANDFLVYINSIEGWVEYSEAVICDRCQEWEIVYNSKEIENEDGSKETLCSCCLDDM